ncbi:MAG TPA: S8 family serine peptidase [Gaiellaceae bacterium]|nr:S8 family serine peptidase [Gaiellaceae bacterium]
MRRSLIFASALALVTATSASAALTPIRRPAGETSLPRVRAGKIVVPAGHARGLTRVIVRLSSPPLAVWNAGRGLASASHTARLDVHSAAARAYVASLARKQAAAAAQVRAAIPQATIEERYSVLLDGFAVQLPERSLAKLTGLSLVNKVYPSLSYYATDDTSAAVIKAADLTAATGDAGQGIKIGVVDTGVDPTNPFLNPEGFSYPPGFPKGDKKLTTPKVIVAKVFPGEPRDKRSNQAFDPTEPHGTHVAGIAAGDMNTTAPAGPDHPKVTDLTGVAPKAWIGNYRVFTVPTPLGHEASTPEIVEAFEAAVADGMNVINFSGGGPQTDPANDAMFETIHNATLAGVVPVIAAGNDRDDFGLGSAGSPAAAPDAIAVAATSNSHVFAQALDVSGGPPSLTAVPIQNAGGAKFPGAWTTIDQTIVDVSSIVGTDKKPVDPYLCGSKSDPNSSLGTLPKGSVKGKILLVSRGICTFASKAERAQIGGATGIILVDNRFGEANQIPIQLPVPGGMISDLDGQTLRAFMAQHGGQATVRLSGGIEEIPTNRAGVITSFSSAGPTDFDWQLKPDISAPGLDILSSTPPLTTGSTFSVFAGTSMATPHVAGAAALLLQQHPGWTAPEVKSALMSTAGPAYQDTARTQEASVLLEGSGLANLTAADDPKIFTAPQSLSFGRVDVSTGTQQPAQLVTLSDAGDGSGTWTATIAPQAQTNGVTISVPGTVTLNPGSFASLPVTVTANGDAQVGENYGFVVLNGNGVQRRIPYFFLVERPALRNAPVVKLKKVQTGDTAQGPNRVSQYCCPAEAFGPPPSYSGTPMNEDGSEHLYSYDVNQPIVNFGVSILAASNGAVVDPFVLGSKDENDVQGYAGIPTDVNGLTYDNMVDVGAAGVQFPRLQRFYVAVDSRADPFTNKSAKGKYVLNAWVNDVTPPAIRILTTRVTAGRPLIVGEAVDEQSGVDPLSLVIGYNRVLVGASDYDPETGLVLFGLPGSAPALKAGKTTLSMQASDLQEAKNINTLGDQIMPNTAFGQVKLTVVNGPAISWLSPPANQCALKSDQLTVIATSTKKVSRVEFSVDGKRAGTDKTGPGGVYSLKWNTSKLKKGTHHLAATLFDAAGRKAATGRNVRVCK